MEQVYFPHAEVVGDVGPSLELLADRVEGKLHNAGALLPLREGILGRIADRAVQIHGGSGYMRGVPVERFYRDARLFRIYEGTSQIQQVIIARGLLGSAARG